jgi:hypothetical protein
MRRLRQALGGHAASRCRTYLLVVLCVGLLTAASAHAASTATSAGWTGTWDTKTGAGNGYIFKLTQSGSSVTGTVTKVGQGTVERLQNGTVKGRVLTFNITSGGAVYRYEFTMSVDGGSFTGKWGYDTDPAGVYGGGTWSGQRAAAQGPAPPKPKKPGPILVDWTGAWDTRASSGGGFNFVFRQTGRRVTGTVQAEGGGPVFTIQKGSVDGLVLTFTLESGGSVNKYEFTMAPGGKSFAGRWGTGSDPVDVYSGGAWSGRRAPLSRFKVTAESRRVTHPYASAHRSCRYGVHSELNSHGLASNDENILALAQAHPGRVTVFQKILCQRTPGGRFDEDHSVQWEIRTGRLVSRRDNLNWGDKGPTWVYTLTLVVEATQSVRFDLCPRGSVAQIVLVHNKRWLANGNELDTATVGPSGGVCPVQSMLWSNADDPATIPPRGGIGRIGVSRGQYADVQINPIPEYN